MTGQVHEEETSETGTKERRDEGNTGIQMKSYRDTGTEEKKEGQREGNRKKYILIDVLHSYCLTVKSKSYDFISAAQLTWCCLVS